jgi:hypothetical protein
MAHLRPDNKFGGFGFDSDNSLVAIPVRQSATIYLVAGEDLVVEIPQQSVATFSEAAVSGKDQALSPGLTPWEKAQNLRRLTINGVGVGSAVLNAYTPRDRRPWVKPLQIEVVTSLDYRQASIEDKRLVLAPKLAQELASLPFRDALIRVAQDQMNSKIGRSPNAGNGKYGVAKDVEWCGAFVHWCYIAVGSVSRTANPLGNSGDPLSSPQKAIGWALHNTDKAQLLRYEGPDPFGWSWDGKMTADKVALKQSFVDVSATDPVQKGDVCLVRESLDPGKGWKHVCMVLDPPDASGTFTTIDGNQTGAFRPDGSGAAQECIGVNSHDANTKIGDGKSYRFVFLHLKGI